MMAERIKRLVIFLSAILSILCAFDAFGKYDKWKINDEKIATAEAKDEKQREECYANKEVADMSQEVLLRCYESIQQNMRSISGYVNDRVEYKQDLELSVKRWILLQASLLILYFGVGWIWTGRLKNK